MKLRDVNGDGKINEDDIPVENTHIPCIAKSIPINLSAGLFSAVWFSQQNKRLAKYFPDGSLLTVTDFSFHFSDIGR